MVATICLALALLTWISMTGARLLLTLYAIEFGAQPFTVGMLIATLQVVRCWCRCLQAGLPTATARAG